ncbi:MAG: hypothetical protein MRJ65_04865 [Candidatus Brocadiaceae bacterium]|nr:hypothetical protein [Candidatus Brocadiaceae bacterium]
MKTPIPVLFSLMIPLFFFGEIFASALSEHEALQLFADANDNYQQAAKFIAAKNMPEADRKLKEAASQYEALVTGGFENGQIYYNLGNTYYRQGELGKAILNYRRADRLMPRNADLDANLRLVKNAIEDKEISHEAPLVVQRLLFWIFLLNQNELTLCAIIFYVILMSALFLLIIFKYAWLKRLIIGFSVALLVLIVSLGFKTHRELGIDQGVVVTHECAVRYGPGDEYEPKFVIHNGAECIIEDEKDGWYKVQVFAGIKQGSGSETDTKEKAGKDIRRGWVQKADLGVI